MDDTMWEIAFDLVPEEFTPQLEAQYARAHPEVPTMELLCGGCYTFIHTEWQGITACTCGMVYQRCICPLCSSSEVVIMPQAGYSAWLRGAYIQDALPGLSDSQRERLMTGICDGCFPKEEDEPCSG